MQFSYLFSWARGRLGGTGGDIPGLTQYTPGEFEAIGEDHHQRTSESDSVPSECHGDVLPAARVRMCVVPARE